MDKNNVKERLVFVAVSLAVGVIVTLALAALFALMMVKIGISSGALNAVIIITLIIASFAVGYANARMTKRKGWLSGLLSGTAFAILIWMIALFTKDYDPTLFTLIKSLLIILSAAVGGIIGVNKRSKRIRI